jgi:hypothetical protein
MQPVCKEEIDNAPITCLLPVKSEPHTDIAHPHTGVDLLGSVQAAGDIQKVSCCITYMIESTQRAAFPEYG